MGKKDDTAGLVSAYRITGSGKAKALGFDSIGTKPKGENWIWLHFDADEKQTRDWLHDASDIDTNVEEALATVGTRPRFESTANGFILILRGVNLNPGENPSDMISIRLYMDENRIITTRREKVMAIFALRELYDTETGPATPAEFIIQLADGLVVRIADIMTGIESEIEAIENANVDDLGDERRARIQKLRSQTIMLGRYLAPQHKALDDLLVVKGDMFTDEQKSALRRSIESVGRYVESLEAVRDRAVAVHEHITGNIAERMNLTMYRLAVVTMISLPLMLLTGLLGINVGGMPGVESGAAFWVVVSALVIMGVGGVWLMKKWKLI